MKQDFLKRIVCALLTAAMVCTMPCMTQIVGASANRGSGAETGIAVQAPPNALASPVETSVPSLGASAPYESGILPMRQTTLSAAPSYDLGMSRDEMTRELLRAKPVFSLQNGSHESIDARSGALSLSYPLATLVGVGGMDLSLTLSYSSAESGALDYGYAEERADGTYVLHTREKPQYTAQNGLSAGWQFSIPSIRAELHFDEEGNADDAYQTILLDNGKAILLDDGVIRECLVYTEGLDVFIVDHPGYAYTLCEGTLFDGKAVASMLSYKDGTVYYFAANGSCLGKADRFGNRICYGYDASNRLTCVRDDFGRSIDLVWTDAGFTVSASDGTAVTVSFSDGLISSVSYGAGELSSFTYEMQNARIGVSENTDGVTVPFTLLTEVLHPAADASSYAYAPCAEYEKDGSVSYLPRVTERSDTVSGIRKNAVTYQYYKHRLTKPEVEALSSYDGTDSVWSQNGIPCDAYGYFAGGCHDRFRRR